MYSNGFITKSVDDPVTSIQKICPGFFFLARALNLVKYCNILQYSTDLLKVHICHRMKISDFLTKTLKSKQKRLKIQQLSHFQKCLASESSFQN